MKKMRLAAALALSMLSSALCASDLTCVEDDERRVNTDEYVELTIRQNEYTRRVSSIEVFQKYRFASSYRSLGQYYDVGVSLPKQHPLNSNFDSPDVVYSAEDRDSSLRFSFWRGAKAPYVGTGNLALTKNGSLRVVYLNCK